MSAYHGWLTPAALDRMRGGVCTVTLVFRRFVCVPRGAYAPRSCIALRTSVGEKTIFPMHKRTLTRAAGVSPPWCRKLHLQRRPTFPNPAHSPRHDWFPSHGWLTPAALDRMRGGVCTVTLVFRRFVCVPRGAYAPRSCIALRTSVGEKTIFSMHKRTLTRAAGVSPPWV
jgi:hypothetical protein